MCVAARPRFNTLTILYGKLGQYRHIFRIHLMMMMMTTQSMVTMMRVMGTLGGEGPTTTSSAMGRPTSCCSASSSCVEPSSSQTSSSPATRRNWRTRVTTNTWQIHYFLISSIQICRWSARWEGGQTISTSYNEGDRHNSFAQTSEKFEKKPPIAKKLFKSSFQTLNQQIHKTQT